jgi:hypothetical protein
LPIADSSVPRSLPTSSGLGSVSASAIRSTCSSAAASTWMVSSFSSVASRLRIAHIGPLSRGRGSLRRKAMVSVSHTARHSPDRSMAMPEMVNGIRSRSACSTSASSRSCRLPPTVMGSTLVMVTVPRTPVRMGNNTAIGSSEYT